MEGFKFKLHTDDIKFELDIDSLDKEEDKDFVRDILRMVDRKSSTMVEKLDREEIKDKLKNAAKGYTALATNKIGIHSGIDEFIIRDVEEELEKENNIEEENNVLNDASEETERKETVDKEEEDKVENSVEIDAERQDDPSIRYNDRKEKLYQTYYICPKCKNKGKRYIPKHSLYTNCHSCFYKMKIQSASYNGFPNKDVYGNIFVAGDFEVSGNTQINNALA